MTVYSGLNCTNFNKRVESCFAVAIYSYSQNYSTHLNGQSAPDYLTTYWSSPWLLPSPIHTYGYSMHTCSQIRTLRLSWGFRNVEFKFCLHCACKTFMERCSITPYFFVLEHCCNPMNRPWLLAVGH